jgi:hypothetical protein
MLGTIVRGMVLAAGVAGTLALGLWANASPRVQDEMAPPKPTPEHEALREDEGAWDGVIKASFPGPDGNIQEAESRGVEVNHMMPGGLWMISNFRGEFGGMPFHGHGVTGFDLVKKKYVGTWVDSFTTSLMTLEGTYDKATRTSTMYGESTDPQGNTAKAKLVEVSKDADHRTMTMYMQVPGGGDDAWQKAMEIHYTRRQGPPPGEFGKEALKKELFKRELPKKVEEEYIKSKKVAAPAPK